MRSTQIIEGVRRALEEFERDEGTDFIGYIRMPHDDLAELWRHMRPDQNGAMTYDDGKVRLYGHLVFGHDLPSTELVGEIRAHEMDTPGGKVTIYKREDTGEVVGVHGPPGTHFDGMLGQRTHVVQHRAVRKRRRTRT